MIRKKERFIRGRKIQNRLTEGLIMLAVGLLSLTCLLPFIHVAAKSVSSNAAVLARSVYLLPKGFQLDAYKSVFADGKMVTSMIFTIFITVAYTAVGMFLTVCAAYPLSKKTLPARAIFLWYIVFTMYFGAGLIPEFLLIKDLHLMNTPWALILPTAFSPYNMLIMKNYIQSSIPDSLEESAYLDGANTYQILVRVVLPLSKPILATLSLFYAVGRWNSYADAKYYITKRSYYPLQYLLNLMVGSNNEIAISEGTAVISSPETLQAACIMFATIPILCIYPFIQKYFVKGAMIGAVKG